MRNIFTVLLMSLLLVGCEGDSSNTTNTPGGRIPQPGNLVSNTKDIHEEGNHNIEIKNVGETQISINDFNVKTEQTKDEIAKDSTDCHGKTLYPQQSCVISLHVYAGEAGTNKLNLNTNVGLYEFPINIDTSQSGVIDSDTKLLTSLKEKVINVYNKGAVPLTLTSLNLEKDDINLTLIDKSCLNKEIAPNNACQIIAKPSVGVSKLHTLSFTPANTLLKTQQLRINEETVLHPENLVSNISVINNDGDITIRFKNTGKYAISFDDIMLENDQTMDEILREESDCYGRTLAPEETCIIHLKVYHGEAGISQLIFNTGIGVFRFPITVDTSQAGIFDIDTKIITSTKEKIINIYNRGAMPLVLSSFKLEEDNKSLNIKDSNCLNNDLYPGKSCQMVAKASVGNSKQHTMFLRAVNQYLKTQQVNIMEETVVHPENLVSEINSITKDGEHAIRMSNAGKYDITFDNIQLQTQQTKDEIIKEKSDCYNKTLAAKQSCYMVLKVYDAEAGISQMNFFTDIGVYKFPINVDTSGNGVVELDTTILKSTREKTIILYNKGAMPLTLNTFKLEEGNKTLNVKDTNCLNNELSSGKYCQMVAKASASSSQQHTMSFTTSNQFLKTQHVQIQEKTDKNELHLFLDNKEDSQSEYVFDKPDEHTFTIKNSGTNDLHINSVALNSNSVGNLENSCNGKVLQAEDSCSVKFNVGQSAYGSALLTINTDEKIDNPVYKINIVNNTLSFIDGSNDLAMHINTTKQLKLINNGNFSVKLNSVTYDNTLMTLSTDCIGVINAKQQCNVNIKSYAQIKDTKLQLNEFDGGLSKLLNVHINDGVTVVYQPLGSSYYAPLPKDGNLYQVFSVINNSAEIQKVNVTARNSVTTIAKGGQIPQSAYLDVNCFTGQDATVQPMSKCEIIIQEPNDTNRLVEIDNDVYNPDKGNLRFAIIYEGGESFIHKYQGKVNRHSEHRDPTYPSGTLINANKKLQYNACGIANGLVTDFVSYDHNDINYPMKGNVGIVITADLIDENTVNIIAFHSTSTYQVTSKTWLEQCGYKQNMRASLLSYSQKTLFDHVVLRYITAEIPVYLDLYMLPNSTCVGNSCNLSGVFYSNEFMIAGEYAWNSATFIRPLPAKDWIVVDNVIWADLGVSAIRK